MLEEFGLTVTEEKVYLTMLRIGSSSASEIIKKTQLHRTTVYDVLDRLIEKGFVSFVVQNKVKFYSAVNPSKFLDIALEDEEKAKEKQKSAKEVIDKIKSISGEPKSGTLTQVFVGDKGLKTVMSEVIEEGKDFIQFGGEGKLKDTLPIFAEQWANQRRKKNIKAKIISIKGLPAPVWKLNEIKVLPKEYQSPTSNLIYGDKVAIFIQEEPVLIILIQSKKLAQSYRNYFNLLWKIAKNLK